MLDVVKVKGPLSGPRKFLATESPLNIMKNAFISSLKLFPRSSQPKVFYKKETQACNFIKNETLAQVFSCEFCQISKNTFSYRTPPVAASVFSFSGYFHFYLDFLVV